MSDVGAMSASVVAGAAVGARKLNPEMAWAFFNQLELDGDEESSDIALLLEAERRWGFRPLGA